MNLPAISLDKISKAYHIGEKEDVPDTMVSALKNVIKSPLKNLSRLRSLDTSRSNVDNSTTASNILWALKDVSFDLEQGDVLGIVGKNGAGKSTLLKVLSRITEPTSGKAIIRGRVSSLLEVGTGFHPELTGRDNIYMNGTILGMTKKEIDRKFDEIVDFSGVEKFLDTPTKRYSSGMQVRLAFAVAAHLEPEIMIVDEVLAVGDAEFQKKCIGKMQSISGSGRTVIFVSHSMRAVRQLCTHGLFLSKGVSSDVVSAEDAIALYEDRALCTEKHWPDDDSAPGDEVVRLLDFEVVNDASTLEIDQEISLRIRYRVMQDGFSPLANVHAYGENETYAFVSHDCCDAWRGRKKAPGIYESICAIPANTLNDGQISFGVAVGSYHPFMTHFWLRDPVLSIILAEGEEAHTLRCGYGGKMPGIVRPALNWQTDKVG